MKMTFFTPHSSWAYTDSLPVTNRPSLRIPRVASSVGYARIAVGSAGGAGFFASSIPDPGAVTDPESAQASAASADARASVML
jgi:hypothetical protein